MFQPTHVVQVRTHQGTRSVALRRTHVHAGGTLQVFRDCTQYEFLQWEHSGTLEWTEYQIRKLWPGEHVPASWLVPGVQGRQVDLQQVS